MKSNVVTFEGIRQVKFQLSYRWDVDLEINILVDRIVVNLAKKTFRIVAIEDSEAKVYQLIGQLPKWPFSRPITINHLDERDETNKVIRFNRFRFTNHRVVYTSSGDSMRHFICGKFRSCTIEDG